MSGSDRSSSSAFDWSQGYASTRSPVFGRRIVSTSHPLAAQAGLAAMLRGGNAIDAAVTAAAVMTIVEPCSNGLGSDAFAIVWDGERLQGLNASGGAPAAWTPAWFRARHGAAASTPPVRGWDAVTVPGAIAAWAALSQRYGRLPFEDLMAPAIEIAERGYAVPPIVQHKWALAATVDELTRQPGFAPTFLPRGRAPAVGELFALPAAGRALRLIARTRGEAFYRGEIARDVAAHARAHGGAMTEKDLATYAPEWVDLLAQRYRDIDLHEIPPNGQGIAALMALGMLQHFDLAALGADSAACAHLQIEAVKLAFADVHAHVAEGQAMAARGVTAEHLLEPAYLAGRARLIDPRRAQEFETGRLARGGTIYLTAADDEGRMVSLIQSNYMGFGSGVVVPPWGVSLQNRGTSFSLDAGAANVVAPGRRPFHTIIPAFVTRGGQPLMSFGVMGGHMQPQGHVQTLVRMLDHRQSPQAACDAPRWRVDGGLALGVETHMPAATVQGLRERGHVIADLADSYQDFGAGQFIWRLGDPAVEGYVAASDPRRDGAAAGW
ncbi:MAG TPA: gamma-glutamyltransferase family protein [Burkholderiaceae bacterium]|nr:gamma-glutamyltransferase family protein [Burkholderiaceae bacterium]